MRDFKFDKLVTELAGWDLNLEGLVSYQTPGLLELGLDYRASLERISSAAALPVELIFQTARNARMTANAIYNATGLGTMSLQEQMQIKQTPEMMESFRREAAEYDAVPVSHQMELRRDLGLPIVQGMLNSNKHMRASIDALYTSIVLESWAFFEALCADAWCVAVDNATPTIAARVISNTKWEADKDGMKAASISGSDLPNAQTNPGSFRREIGLVSFQRLRAITTYYEIAFGSELKKAIIDTADGYIRALSEIRNCILHRAGKVDEKAIKILQQFPDWRDLKKGDKLVLDGEAVRKLRSAALAVGREILSRLDAMLVAGV